MLEYKEFMKTVNEEPNSEHVTIFVSDWNKEEWAFYAHIALSQYQDDIEEIQDLIKRMNWKDQDVYVEMVDCSQDMTGFYSCVESMGYLDNWQIMDPELWEMRDDNTDEFFNVASQVLGSVDKDGLQSMIDEGYSIYEDYDEALENLYPELYEALEKASALCCFDSEHMFNGWGEIHEVKIGYDRKAVHYYG
jgi:hypothetical protein